ncbi:MAG: ferredoxin:glutaredoxin reductase [Gaiellales bacterium]|nr:MAG: ferredoxin:glutaredoxin reductase [Gaiellales bacterium]
MSSAGAIDELYEKLDREAREGGYHLNPDREFTRELVEGLAANQERFGYMACPCRLADGERARDLDIICPCYYRDPDLAEYGQCYCALYVSEAVVEGEAGTGPIPERRPEGGVPAEPSGEPAGAPGGSLSKPVWRCRVCGYLCGRDEPPEHCPICGADSDRFERFM